MATYYVSTTGLDTNSGTILLPFRTFVKGISVLNPGDTLYIRGGTYTDSIDMTTRTGGSVGVYYTVAGYPGETVTLNGNYSPFAIKGTFAAANSYYIFEHLILDGTNSGNLQYWTIAGPGAASTFSHDIIIRDVEIKRWKGNGLLTYGNNVQVLNCRIHDQISVSGVEPERWYGVYFAGGTGGLIEGNQIYNNPGGGMQIYPGATATNVITNLIVRKNIIHHNNILASSGIGGIFIGLVNGPGTGIEIYNNLIYSNGRSGPAFNAYGVEVGANLSGLKILHNTIYDNKGYGVVVSNTNTGTKIQNNILYLNDSGGLLNNGVASTASNNLTTNPLFVNAAANDFHLLSGSPAVNTGVAVAGMTIDYDGVTRNNPPEIGAFEFATTYYISPSGLDTSNGLTTSTPWRTWDKAFSVVAGGDTLLVMDGTYTTANNTRPYILSKNFSAAGPLTIRAVNERKAWILGTGGETTFLINLSSHIVIDGLRISSQNNPAFTVPNAIMGVIDANNLTFKKILYHTVNRSANFIVQSFTRVFDSLTEDCEAYDFHRHAFGCSNSDRNTFRRLYGHDRGPYPGNSGDSLVTWYPGSFNIAENCISEGDSYVVDIQALGISQENKVYGCIGIGNTAGAFAAYKCRSNDSGSNVPTNMPINNTLENIVWIGHTNAIGWGITLRGTRNTQVKHASIFNPSTTNFGFSADVEAANPGAPPYSVFVEDSFVYSTQPTPYGFIIAGQTSWALTKTNAFGNTTNYQPVTPNPNHNGVLSVNPQMGTCRLWVPTTSPMKGAGTNGSDIGATVLYRYLNGTLTTTPLWDPVTGKFPHGALVTGINDLPGQSLFDVHTRLGIGINPFPPGYGSGGSDTTPPAAPTGLQVT